MINHLNNKRSLALVFASLSLLISSQSKAMKKRTIDETNNNMTSLTESGFKKQKIDIFEAIQSGEVELVQQAINDGADLNNLNRYGKTPLMMAAEKNLFDIVKILVNNGADINAKSSREETALLFAAEHGHLNVVKYLCSNGANIDEKNFNGNTALHLAIVYDHLDTVKYLCENGANIHLQHNLETPRKMAKSTKQIANYLCNKAAENIHNALYDADILKAELDKYTDKGELLADLNNNNNDEKMTALERAVSLGITDSVIEVVQILLQKGAQAKDHPVAMIALEKHKNKELAELLLKNREGNDIVNSNGDTLLEWAKKNENSEYIELIKKYQQQINFGPKLNILNHGLSGVYHYEGKNECPKSLGWTCVPQCIYNIIRIENKCNNRCISDDLYMTTIEKNIKKPTGSSNFRECSLVTQELNLNFCPLFMDMESSRKVKMLLFGKNEDQVWNVILNFLNQNGSKTMHFVCQIPSISFKYSMFYDYTEDDKVHVVLISVIKDGNDNYSLNVFDNLNDKEPQEALDDIDLFVKYIHEHVFNK